MERAFVLVGVSRTGGLPELPAVGRGLAAVRQWVADQGVPDDLVVTCTDADGGSVEVQQLFDAVKAFADRRTVGQLVVYFCGHGVVNDGTELWLLSGAPEDTAAAVNVAKSVRLAERGSIPHVVLLSDACRSATVSLRMGEVSGSPIFPNPAVVGARSVDVLFATRVGESSHQVAPEQADAEAELAAAAFEAVWSEVVAEALAGDYPEVLETVTEAGVDVDLVRPWPLQRALPGLVYARLDELGAGHVLQVPDGRITSDPSVAWLSRLTHPPTEPRRGGGLPAAPRPSPPDPADRAAEEAARRLLTEGADLDLAPPARFSVVGVDGYDVRAVDGAALVTFPQGCLVVPSYGDLGWTVTVEDGLVVDVRWRGRWPETELDEGWRTWLAVGTRFGLRRVGRDEEPSETVRRAAEAGLEDPSVPVYVAHGLVDAGLRALVPELLHGLQERGAPVPYDVALLAEDLRSYDGPSLPLLARGWPLLGEDGVAPLPDLPGRLPSLWTTFRPEAADALIAHLGP